MDAEVRAEITRLLDRIAALEGQVAQLSDYINRLAASVQSGS